MSFTLHLKKITEKAGAQADNVAKKIILDVFSSVTLKSPVDTGRFRGNWQLQSGLVDAKTDSPEDKTGQLAIAAANIKIKGYSSKLITYISNSLPYAQRLENGYSDQAPQGMVRLTVIEFRRMIRKAAR
jgi:hypothetical protein